MLKTITIRVAATVPTQQYGSIRIELEKQHDQLESERSTEELLAEAISEVAWQVDQMPNPGSIAWHTAVVGPGSSAPPPGRSAIPF